MKATALRPALLVAGALAIGGCNLYGDQYVEGALDEILGGGVRSNQNRYRIAAPRIAAVRRNTGIVREGSMFLVIVGPDLRKQVGRQPETNVEYGVKIRKEPRTHLVLEKIWFGDTEIDLFEGDRALRAEFPEFVSSSDLPLAEFEEAEGFAALGPRDDAPLTALEGKRLGLSKVRLERAVLPEPAASVALATDPRLRIEQPQFVLRTDGCDWILVGADLTTALMLDFLIADERPFSGGVVVKNVFVESTRESTGFAGTMQTRWLNLGGTLYFKAK